MANNGDTTTTLSNFFKQRYRQHMGSEVQRASALTELIAKRGRKIEVGGASLNTIWCHEKGEGVGIAAGTEGGDFPLALPGSALQFSLGLAHIFATVEWTGLSLAMGTGEKNAFFMGNLVKRKAKELKNKVKKFVARQSVWDGTDVLCQVGTVSGTTNGYFTIKSGGCPIHFFEIGDKLTARDAASSGTEQLTNAATGAGVVVDIDYINGRVYLADVSGLAADDYIAWSGFYDATVINGLRGLIDSSGSVQGVNRATAGNFLAQAYELPGASGALTSSLIDELRDTVSDLTDLRDGSYTTVWAGNRKMRRWATLAAVGQNRFADLDLTLGVASIKVGDKDGPKTFIEDPYLIDAEIYAICPEKFVWAYPQGMEGGYFVENNGSVIFQKTGATAGNWADAQQSLYVWRGNIGCDDFRCQGKLTTFVSP